MGGGVGPDSYGAAKPRPPPPDASTTDDCECADMTLLSKNHGVSLYTNQMFAPNKSTFAHPASTAMFRPPLPHVLLGK